jgi:hypothetical protein
VDFSGFARTMFKYYSSKRYDPSCTSKGADFVWLLISYATTGFRVDEEISVETAEKYYYGRTLSKKHAALIRGHLDKLRFSVLFNSASKESQKLFTEKLAHLYPDVVFAEDLKSKAPADIAWEVFNGILGCGGSGNKRASAWRKYHATIENLVNENVFSESFTIKQIYVPLNGYYLCNEEASARHKPAVKRAIDAKQYLNEWISKRPEPICFISGDPGSGKSTLAKIYAAELVGAGDVNAIFISLKDLGPRDFSQDTSFETVVNEYVQQVHEIDLPIFPPKKHTIIILDGLDEVALRGESTERLARSFLEKVYSSVHRINKQSVSLQVLVTCRSIIIDKMFELGSYMLGSSLTLLPYSLDVDSDISGEPSLLMEDKRDFWWERYGELTGKGFSKMPDDIRIWDSARKLTSQPILNHLIALCYEDMDFASDPNIAVIYQTLIEGLIKRENEGVHKAAGNLAVDRYMEFLECAALCAWHSTDSSISIEKLRSECCENGLEDILNLYETNQITGLKNYLIAGYIKPSRWKDGESSYEFVHRSFMEFLTSKAIVRYFRENDIREMPFDSLVGKLLYMFGPSAISAHLLDFLYAEYSIIANDEDDALVALQEYLLESFENLISIDAWLDEELLEMAERLSPPEERQWRLNTQVALLAMYSSVAANTQERCTLKYLQFYNWIVEVGGHNPVTYYLPRRCLNNIIFDDSRTREVLPEFRLVNGSDATMAAILETSFQGARFEGAFFTGSSLVGHDFTRADLSRSSLRNTDLSHTVFNSACLEGADLTGANLSFADFTGANLNDANLEDTILENVVFANASLLGTTFSDQNYLLQLMGAMNE